MRIVSLFREDFGPEKKKMDQVRAIQEIVDEHKDKMPTGVVTDVLDQCQKAYNAMSNLYKLAWTVVKSHAQVHEDHEGDESPFASVELSDTTQTLIVEAVGLDRLNDRHSNCRDLINHGMVLKSYVKMSMPTVMKFGSDMVVHVPCCEGAVGRPEVNVLKRGGGNDDHRYPRLSCLRNRDCDWYWCRHRHRHHRRHAAASRCTRRAAQKVRRCCLSGTTIHLLLPLSLVGIVRRMHERVAEEHTQRPMSLVKDVSILGDLIVHVNR